MGPGRALVILATLAVALPGCAGARRKPLAGEQRVTIVAENYQFIPSTVQVARGQGVVLTLKSGDRGYGFEVPDLDVKAYIPAGRETTVRLTPARAGEYTFRCTAPATQACWNMRGTLRVR